MNRPAAVGSSLLSLANPTAELLSQLRVEIHLFTHYHGDSSWRHPGKLLPRTAFYLVESGDGQISDFQRKCPLLPGHAYLLPPNTPLSVRCKSTIVKFWGWLSVELFPNLDLFEGVEGFVELGKYDLGEPRELFLQRLGRFNANDYFYLESLLLRLLAQSPLDIGALIARQSRNFASYREILAQINQEARFGMRVETLARQLNVTPSSLSRAFRRDMGVTLKSHINGKLNKRACSLLVGTGMKIRQVATSLGFADEYYFIRFFTKQNGLSPSAYREFHLSMTSSE